MLCGRSVLTMSSGGAQVLARKTGLALPLHCPFIGLSLPFHWPFTGLSSHFAFRVASPCLFRSDVAVLEDPAPDGSPVLYISSAHAIHKLVNCTATLVAGAVGRVRH